MARPSDFSPPGTLESSQTADSKVSLRFRWGMRAVGVGIVAVGWAIISVADLGTFMFLVDTAIFVGLTVFAVLAAAASRRIAVSEERKQRLALLVHNMELENLSLRDELTQLFNRRHLFERLERELHTASGFQRPLAFIAMHVHSLARINRAYGYATGDRILAALGRRLMDLTRATDIPARISGGRFGIILPDTDKARAYMMLERLTESINGDPLLEDTVPEIQDVGSLGVSGYPWSGDTIDAIVQQAEAEAVGQADGDELEERQETGEQIPAAFRRLDEAAREDS